MLSTHIFNAIILFSSFILIPNFIRATITPWNTISSRCLTRGVLDKAGPQFYGYDVSLSSGEDSGNYTYMAISRPWNSSHTPVYIYRIPTPERTPIDLYKTLDKSANFTPPSYNSLSDWELFTILRDDSHVSNRPQSLFGYSLSLNWDGSHLAVGIPGRSKFYHTTTSWENTPYHGAIRVYKRQVKTIASNNASVFNGNVPAMNFRVTDFNNTGSLNWIYLSFNSTVTDPNIYPTSFTSGNAAETFTIANLPGICPQIITRILQANSKPCTFTFNFTLAPQSSVTFDATTFRFDRLFAAGNLTGFGWVITSGSVSRASFGLTFDTFDVERTATGTTGDIYSNTKLMPYEKFGSKVTFSRDTNTTFLFATSNFGYNGIDAPSLWKSTSGWTTPSEFEPWVYHSDTRRLGVYVYRKNSVSGLYEKVQFIPARTPVPLGMVGIDLNVLGTAVNNTVLAMRDWYPVKNATEPSGQVRLLKYDETSNQFIEFETISNRGLSESKYTREDWFGKGIAMTVDSDFDRLLTAIGAPRDSRKAYTFHRNYSTVFTATPALNAFNPGQQVLNDEYRPRSQFFGGSMRFSTDSEFLIVSDASGIKGRGKMYLYRKKDKGVRVDLLPAFGLESAAIPGTEVDPYQFFKVAELIKPNANGNNYSQSDVYETDWFGNSIAVNWWMIATSAAVDECVYLYPMPQVYVSPSVYNVPNITETNSTRPTPTIDVCNNVSAWDVSIPSVIEQYYIQCLNSTAPTRRPTSTPTDTETVVVANSDATLYAMIAGIASLFIMLPIAFYIAKKIHMKRVQKRLENELIAKQLLSNNGLSSSEQPLTSAPGFSAVSASGSLKTASRTTSPLGTQERLNTSGTRLKRTNLQSAHSSGNILGARI